MGLDTAVQGLIAGSRAAVGRFLNQLTYYEMKKRAGIVGVAWPMLCSPSSSQSDRFAFILWAIASEEG